jgi:uncharacterized membrane protein YcaP (DUF421 family)
MIRLRAAALCGAEQRAWSDLWRPDMWSDILVLQEPLAEKVFRAALVYVVLLILIRVTGKRALASMNIFDLIVVLLIAGVVEDAIVGADTSVLGGAISAVTLVAVNRAVSFLVDTSPLAARILEGKPTTVIENGQVVHNAIRKLGLRASELEHAIRSQNGDDVREVEIGKLTPSGQLVVSLKPDEQSSTKADVAALTRHLRRIEELLTSQHSG